MRGSLRLGTILATLGLLSGCLFNVEHRLPPRTYFGKLPAQASEQRVPFALEAPKSWYLAGWFAYTDWGAKDLLAATPATRVENVEIQTQFTRRDTIIWVIPGFLYGYYFWAPRTIRVTGTRVVASDPS